jgi:hypothetical protein
MARALSVAFVLPFGEPRQSFFPDVIAELCARRAEELGHVPHVARVYYDGRDPTKDSEVRAALERWLSLHDADVVVVERLFDPEPILRHVRAKAGRRAVLVSWGDAEPIEGVELVVGLTPGLVRRGVTRRSPSGGELVESFAGLLSALGSGDDAGAVPGVARFVDGALLPGPVGRGAKLPRPFRPLVAHDVIATGDTPAITRKFLLGNAGCPYGNDPAESSFYRGLPLATDGSLSRLGCTFCHAGGDYQKRDDSEVVSELIEQALFYQEHVAGVDELVLVDQHPLRYLARLVADAHAAGMRPTRWLFAARADSFVREQQRVRDAIAAARAIGHSVEVYLSGFESFSEQELVRYNKGVGVNELVAAVDTMRTLRRESGGAFEYARARGHSLILWSPWTTPEDLAESAATIRDHGLSEIFSELGRNRLRLYPELPIFHAAKRDGALTDSWDSGDEGAGRRKGYAIEHPWRFLDPRTRLAYAIALGLRERLGSETEVSQLAAIAALTAAARVENAEQQAAVVLSSVDALAERLLAIARGRTRGPSVRASVVELAGVDDDVESVMKRIADARQSELPIMLAGREPAVHPAFLDFVTAARGDDGRAVGIVTNGQRFDDLAVSAARAGLSAASVKVAPGAHQQTLAGIAALRAAEISLELRASLDRENYLAAHKLADLAVAVSVPRLRIEIALDALGLDRAGAVVDAIDRLSARCRTEGVTLDASPLSSGARGFGRMPGQPR